VPNHYPEHYPPKEKMLMLVIRHLFPDLSQSGTLSEIKPLLRAYFPDIYTVKKGVITQIDQVTSSSRAFAISDIEFVIFMGLRIDNDIKNTSRIGNKFPFLRSE
jgi:hypothetical protein